MKVKDTQLIWEAYLLEAPPVSVQPARTAPAGYSAPATSTSGLVNINAGPAEVLAVVPKLLENPEL